MTVMPSKDESVRDEAVEYDDDTPYKPDKTKKLMGAAIIVLFLYYILVFILFLTGVISKLVMFYMILPLLILVLALNIIRSKIKKR